jgi:hypothetical protein
MDALNFTLSSLDLMYQVSTVRRANVVVFRRCSDTDPGLRVHPRCVITTLDYGRASCTQLWN